MRHALNKLDKSLSLFEQKALELMDNPPISSYDKTGFAPAEIADLTPVLMTVASQKDANPGGDIFGGWLLGQMDIAGALETYRHVRKRFVTVGVDAMTFKQPVFVGDEVCFFTSVHKIGNTSITIKIESWARRGPNHPQTGNWVKVTEGLYSFVCIDDQHRPTPIKQV